MEHTLTLSIIPGADKATSVSSKPIEQQVVDWIIEVPWQQFLKPLLSDVFGPMLGDFFDTVAQLILGPDLYQGAKRALETFIDHFKKDGPIGKLILDFNRFLEQNKDDRKEILQKLKDMLTGKLTFNDLAAMAMTGLKQALMKPLVELIDGHLPRTPLSICIRPDSCPP